jgi:hypothetical protein
MKSCEGCRTPWFGNEEEARCLADTRDIETFVEKYQDWSWSRYEYQSFVVDRFTPRGENEHEWKWDWV